MDLVLITQYFDYLSEVNAYVDSQAPWSLKNTDNHYNPLCRTASPQITVQ